MVSLSDLRWLQGSSEIAVLLRSGSAIKDKTLHEFTRLCGAGNSSVANVEACSTWVWVKIKPLGIGPQVLVHDSIYQGNPFWVHSFDPQPDPWRKNTNTLWGSFG